MCHLDTRDREYLFQQAMEEYCTVLAGKMGSKETIISELGRKFPNFDPAVMEAAF